MTEIAVFTAARIHTMSRSAPEAQAVAVRDGVILEAGTLESMAPWLAAPHRVDDRFADKTILPGFIDPHLHPSLGAALLPSTFITAFDWCLPNRVVKAVRGREAYLARLAEAVATEGGGRAIFITWGYHQLWHGAVTKADLNAIAPDHPVVVWQRSFHEIILNDAAIAYLGIDAEVIRRHPQIDATTGRFSEMGAMVALGKLRPFLFGPDWMGAGLKELLKVLHFGGHTTVADMAWGVFDFEFEWSAYSNILADAPLRCMMIPRGIPDPELTGAPEDAVKRIEALMEREDPSMFFGRHVKLFTDGAFFSELMQLQPPGFIDGHHGEWLTPPDQFRAAARAYWNAGFRIHVHCTGDLGVELALETLEELQWERPRFNHGFTIEHFGVSTEEQTERIAALGAQVSANIYYLHELGDAYWRGSIGHERASQMARLGSLARAGVPFALHSDFTMAPANPLNSAWVAVNRVGETGEVLCPAERISVDQAMRAITIDAAHMIGRQDEIGSIRSGKRADFTVLDEDPYAVDPMRLREIGVHATVFAGVPHEVARP